MMNSRLVVTVLLLACMHPGGVALAMSEAMSECLLARLETADAGVTVGELNKACIEELDASVATATTMAAGSQRDSAVGIRQDADSAARANRFVISTYKQNYFMVTHNSDPNTAAFDAPDGAFDEEEVKFQVSFKMPLATGLFGGNTDLIFAYTSTSWWQLFNNDADNVFRETNYEPEVFLENFPKRKMLGMDFASLQFGINHQSNGQFGTLSRGWDRFFGSAAVELTDDVVVGMRAWYTYRRQENNEDINRYMGYGEIGLGWVPNRHTLTLLYRPATEGDAVQLTWSYPISKYLRIYAQYWNGYGESLIDYDVRTKRYGIGLALSDILAR